MKKALKVIGELTLISAVGSLLGYAIYKYVKSEQEIMLEEDYEEDDEDWDDDFFEDDDLD